MRKKLIASAMAMVMVCSLAACGSSGSSGTSSSGSSSDGSAATEAATEAEVSGDGGENYKVAALFRKYDDVYLSTVRVALESYAEEAGNIDLICYDGQSDAGKQLDQLDSILSKGVDCLLVNMQDQASAPMLISQVQDTGIPVIFFNREPTDLTELENYESSIYIGTQAEDAGIMQGDMLTDIWNSDPSYDRNGDGTVQYVVMKGEADNVEAIARSEYVVSRSEENGLKMEAVAEEQICDWLAETAMSKMNAILSTQSDTIEAVLCNNDDMATGVISALVDYGMNTGEEGSPSIIVLGVDATDAGVSLIKNGQMQGTVKQDGDAMAKACVEAVLSMVEGGSKEDAAAAAGYDIDSTGVAIRIPYSQYTGE